MALQLRRVEARQGIAWVRQAFAVYLRRPLAFTALLATFLLGGSLLAAVFGVAGQWLALCAVPQLSLGFMIATRAVLEGRPMHLGVFIEPLRGNAQRRRTLLLLCASYGVLALAVMLAWDAAGGDALERWQAAAADPAAPIDPELEQQMLRGLWVLLVLGGALSVPYWHAAALVHWGGQGVAQALFSSTVAVWRTRGAFVLYLLAWALTITLSIVVLSLLLRLLGMPRAVGFAAMPLGLMLSAAFYVSLWFTFAATFGSTADEPGTAR